MSITKKQFWECNDCRCQGPEFVGTASEVQPKGWWTGEVGLEGSGSTLAPSVHLAICPDCLPEFWCKYLSAHECKVMGIKL